jgi:hypothetical protein
MTTLNKDKCKCAREHTLIDVLTTEDNLKVIYRQKWHNCYYCKKFVIAKWIRLHEVRCDTKWANHLA